MALTGRAALVALVGVVVVALLAPSWAGVLAVQGLLALAVGVDVALAAPVRRLRLHRTGDTRVRLGDPATLTLIVANPGPRPLHGWLRDAWPPSAGARPVRQRLDVPAGQAGRLTVELRPTRRGDRSADRVTVRAVGPLGLAARQGTHRVPWTVRVLPAFASRRHLPALLVRLREIEGRVAAQVRGPGTELDSLREYVPGDDVRAIDWRATARRADVLVRTWRPERDRQLVVVLDTGRTSAGRVGDAPRLDAALDATLLLAALAARAGDRVGLVAHDRRLRVYVGYRARNELLPNLVQAISGLEPDLVETDMRGLVSAVLRRAGRHSLVVLFSTLDAAPVEEGLLPVLPLLTARHTVLLASVADPAVEAMAAGRGDAPAVYAAAAAERARAERARVTAVLGRLGVVVVHAPPDRLPRAVSDAYLRLKEAGRL